MSAPAATAPFLAATLVLGAAGAAKAWRPEDTARALRAAGAGAGRHRVRVLALGEVAVAVFAIARPGPLSAALVAGSYLAFAAFVTMALRRGWALASCGCFGRPDTPPTRAHAVLDVAAAASAVWWGATAPSRIGAVFAHQPWDGVPLTLVTVLLAGLAYCLWTNPLAGLSR